MRQGFLHTDEFAKMQIDGVVVPVEVDFEYLQERESRQFFFDSVQEVTVSRKFNTC